MEEFSQNAFGLIIGIANYKNITNLPIAVINDATDVYTTLTDEEICLYRKENLELVTESQATKQGILSALARLASKSNEDATVWIYISCHGGRVNNGIDFEEFLLPVDADLTSITALENTSISSDEISDSLRSIPARKMVVIFDCCHSGGIGSITKANNLTIKAGLSNLHYERLMSGHGRVILASSRSDESSWVLSGERNSLFTTFLLKGLRGEVAGTDGYIRIFDLFNYVQSEVANVRNNQHPLFKAEVEQNFPIGFNLSSKSENNKIEREMGDEKPYEYDVFISYSHEDVEWVRKILLPYLDNDGIKVCIDFRDFQLGSPIIDEIERAVSKSQHTLAILSPNYLKSRWTELENILAEHLGLEVGKRILICLMKEKCNPHLRTRSRIWLDMTTDQAVSENINRLLNTLKKQK